MDEPTKNEQFSITKRVKSVTHAWRGLQFFLKYTHASWIHLTVFVFVLVLAFYFNITRLELIALILSAGLVLITEAINTAIEIDINLTSPDYHPYARDSKDVAAGAVLISAIFATIVGLLVFVPYILML